MDAWLTVLCKPLPKNIIKKIIGIFQSEDGVRTCICKKRTQGCLRLLEEGRAVTSILHYGVYNKIYEIIKFYANPCNICKNTCKNLCKNLCKNVKKIACPVWYPVIHGDVELLKFIDSLEVYTLEAHSIYWILLDNPEIAKIGLKYNPTILAEAIRYNKVKIVKTLSLF